MKKNLDSILQAAVNLEISYESVLNEEEKQKRYWELFNYYKLHYSIVVSNFCYFIK